MLTREDITSRAHKIVVEMLDADPEKVTREADFIDNLGADSLDHVEPIMAFEEEFDVEILDGDAEDVKTFGDAVDLIAKLLSVPA